MIIKLIITCNPITLIPRSATEETLKLSNKMGHLHHTQDFHHLHRTKHIPTCYILYSSYMLAQEHVKMGVTEVCHVAHFWESYGRCAMPGLPVG